MSFLLSLSLAVLTVGDLKDESQLSYPEPYAGFSALLLPEAQEAHDEIERFTINLGLPFQVRRFDFVELRSVHLMVFPEFNFSPSYFGATFGVGPEVYIPWSSWQDYGMFFSGAAGPFVGYIMSPRLDELNDSLLFGGYVGMSTGPYFSLYQTFNFRLRLDTKLLVGNFENADIKAMFSNMMSVWFGTSFQVYF